MIWSLLLKKPWVWIFKEGEGKSTGTEINSRNVKLYNINYFFLNSGTEHGFQGGPLSVVPCWLSHALTAGLPSAVGGGPVRGSVLISMKLQASDSVLKA